jgi:hypothetical protein
MTCACLILNRELPARHAAAVAQMCGPIGDRSRHMPERVGAVSSILVEGYADLLPLTPDDMTGNVRAVRFKD